MDNYQKNSSSTTDLNTLVNMIVDYYCFKNNIFDDDASDDNESWKKGTNLENPEEEIIPEKIDGLIEKVFEYQLKKFTKD